MGVVMSDDIVRIRGRILDKDGNPVEMAYLFANRKKGPSEFPDFISGWSDEKGYFTFYVPKGTYYVGAATSFPPLPKSVKFREMSLERDEADLNVVVDRKEELK